jgi:hypothetical protein
MTTSDELMQRRSAREKARDARMLADLRDFRRSVITHRCGHPGDLQPPGQPSAMRGAAVTAVSS